MLVVGHVRNEWIFRYTNKKTRQQAKNALQSLDKFIEQKYENDESLFLAKCKEPPEDNRYFVLDSLIQWWKMQEYSVPTMHNYFTFIRDYLRRHGIKTHDDDVKDYIKFPKYIEEEKEPITKEQIIDILNVSKPKYQCFFLCLASSGMRVGEFTNAKVSWLNRDFYKKTGNYLIHIPGEFTKGQRDRYTFFSKQASKLLDQYVSKRINDGKLLDITYDGAKEYMRYIREKLEMNERYHSGFHKITIHSFRSYTDTILTDFTNSKFSAMILGHKRGSKINENEGPGGLRYYRKSPEKALEFYEKAEPELTIQYENLYTE
ncbi:MAG: site-specific integrase [Nitrososphaera sp.]|jgi:integrase